MADLCKLDNFRWFFRKKPTKNYHGDLPKSEKDASRWNPNLSGQKFSSKINSSVGIFAKTEKMAKIAHLEPPWSLNTNFAGHPVCGKMLGI